jgi:hypothetical protein
MTMRVILSGGEAGGREVEAQDGAVALEVDGLLYRIEPLGKKDDPNAPRVAVFTGVKEG